MEQVAYEEKSAYCSPRLEGGVCVNSVSPILLPRGWLGPDGGLSPKRPMFPARCWGWGGTRERAKHLALFQALKPLNPQR